MTSRRRLRAAGWLLVGGLVVAAAFSSSRPAGKRPARTPVLELLGPLAGLASNVQWIRFQGARHAGEQERAILFAESALELAPEVTAGWELFASHLGLFLSSNEREPDPGRTLAWVRAPIEVTREQ